MTTENAGTRFPADLHRQLLDNSSDPIFCFAPDFRYLYANQAFADGIGRNLDEIVGRSVWNIFPKDEADKRADLVKWVFDHGQAEAHEILVRGRDGDRYYLTTLTPIFGDQGRASSVLANSKDITDRKKLEDELRHNQTMLAHTENFTHIGSWEWDLATDTVTWSDELFRIFLRNPADGAPSFAEHAKLYHPEDILRLEDAVKAAVSHGTPYKMELRAIRQDGETRVCLARGFAEMGPDQTVKHLFGSLQDITERKQAEAALSESDAFLRVIIDSVPDQVAVIDQDGVIVRVNEPWRRFSLENSSVPGKPAPLADVGTNYMAVCRASTGHAEGSKAAHEGIQAVLEGMLPNFSMDYPCHSPDQQRWFTMRVTPLGGTRRGAVIAHTNITDRVLANDALRQQQVIYRAVTDHGQALIWMSGLDKGCYYFNAPWLAFTGRTIEQEQGNGWAEGVHPDDIQRCLETYGAAFDRREVFEMEYRLRRHDGAYRWIIDEGTPRYDSGNFSGFVGHCLDITDRKQAEDQVRQLAFHDALTKLPNRRLLDDRLRQAMVASKRRGYYGAVMFLDLDNFKPLNDRWGHKVGDMLLIEAADRLKNCTREMDTVARFGGDEFVVIVSELAADKTESIVQATAIAEKIRLAISEPYRLTVRLDELSGSTVEYHCTVTIGAALFISHDSSPDDILKWADAAMYEAKAAGRNMIRYYDSAN